MAVAFYPSLPLNLTYCSALRRELERNLLSLIFVRISNLSTVSRAMFRYVSSRGPRATSYFSPSPFFLFFLPSIPLSPPVLRFSLLSLVPHRDTPDLPLLSFSFFFFFNCSHFRGVGRITASNRRSFGIVSRLWFYARSIGYPRGNNSRPGCSYRFN